MNFWVQYHNAEKLDDLPGDFPYDPRADVCTLDTTLANQHTISTTKSDILNALGDVVFMIVGYGAPKRRYALWSWTLLEELYESDEGGFDAEGDCQILNPPQELQGEGFAAFKKHVGNFGLGFQKITDHPYVETLIQLAVNGTGVNLSENDVGEFAGNISNASEILEAEGAFDAPNDDAELIDRVLREVAARRGQPRFRDDLMVAYSGQCVITGTKVDGVLEAAHIIPVADEPFFHVTNGLLLRADVHALFDQGLLWIEPETRRVRTHESLMDSEYAAYNGRPLAEPRHPEQRPSRDALQKRILMFETRQNTESLGE
jgi:hypothetical protein